MSFDPQTGDLWGGDVGQNTWEEIDIITRGGNYGWKPREGFEAFGLHRGEPDPDADYIDPVVVYPRDKGISVTGGCVSARPAPVDRGGLLLRRLRFGRIWGLRWDGSKLTRTARSSSGAPSTSVRSISSTTGRSWSPFATPSRARDGSTRSSPPPDSDAGPPAAHLTSLRQGSPDGRGPRNELTRPSGPKNTTQTRSGALSGNIAPVARVLMVSPYCHRSP